MDKLEQQLKLLECLVNECAELFNQFEQVHGAIYADIQELPFSDVNESTICKIRYKNGYMRYCSNYHMCDNIACMGCKSEPAKNDEYTLRAKLLPTKIAEMNQQVDNLKYCISDKHDLSTELNARISRVMLQVQDNMNKGVKYKIFQTTDQKIQDGIGEYRAIVNRIYGILNNSSDSIQILTLSKHIKIMKNISNKVNRWIKTYNRKNGDTGFSAQIQEINKTAETVKKQYDDYICANDRKQEFVPDFPNGRYVLQDIPELVKPSCDDIPYTNNFSEKSVPNFPSPVATTYQTTCNTFIYYCIHKNECQRR